MVNVTNQHLLNDDKKHVSDYREIGTVGVVGRARIAGMVLPTVDVDTGGKGAQWFTFETIERLGLLRVPLSLIVVPVESVRLGVAP